MENSKLEKGIPPIPRLFTMANGQTDDIHIDVKGSDPMIGMSPEVIINELNKIVKNQAANGKNWALATFILDCEETINPDMFKEKFTEIFSTVSEAYYAQGYTSASYLLIPAASGDRQGYENNILEIIITWDTSDVKNFISDLVISAETEMQKKMYN